MISVVVWGTGNMGRLAVRSVEAHPGLRLTGVIVHDPAKVGRDAGDLAASAATSASRPPPTPGRYSPPARRPSCTRRRATSGRTTPSPTSSR
ncbi:hypothetical protein ACFQY7_50700 [Actinomadura luteofluorescens]|uniref:hypothetical protein n=1 Tax=Actinomadura luteofluorescens TaxID=46163 RepID=UPI0036370BB6